MRLLLSVHVRKVKGLISLWSLLIMAGVSPFITMGSETKRGAGIIFGYLVIMHLFSSVTKFERKIAGHEDVFLNSLPISRSDIVISRYVIIFLSGITAAAVLIVYHAVMLKIFGKSLNLSKVFFVQLAMIQFIYNIIFIPGEFINYKMAAYVKSIFYLVCLVLIMQPEWLIRFIQPMVPIPYIPVLLTALAVAGIPLSLFISIRAYKKKEF